MERRFLRRRACGRTCRKRTFGIPELDGWCLDRTVKGHQDRRAFSGLDDRVAAEARFFIGAPGARVVHIWVNGHDRRSLDLQPLGDKPEEY